MYKPTLLEKLEDKREALKVWEEALKKAEAYKGGRNKQAYIDYCIQFIKKYQDEIESLEFLLLDEQKGGE